MLFQNGLTTQQPLPSNLQVALRDALSAGSREAFVHAIDVARGYGYT